LYHTSIPGNKSFLSLEVFL